MNRISHGFPDVETLLEASQPKRPVEALVVDRNELVNLFRCSLMHLHEHRRRVAGTAEERKTVQRIKYWDDVLGWVKEREGREVLLLERTTGCL